jgi:uncharacterized protein YjiS (DUF1127 family)
VAEKLSFVNQCHSANLKRKKIVKGVSGIVPEVRGSNMTAMELVSAGLRGRPASGRVGQAARGLLASLHEWRRRARDRADLAGLDNRMLADIGLTRADAEFLINKPFWRE